MKFDVKIDCMALFNECMDQTLIDYRNRTTETGQSIAATHTLDRSLLDTFYVNLHSVSKALRTALRKQVCEVLFIPDLLQYRMYLDPGIPPESIAVEVKDALKYGMLCWWYGGRDIPLIYFIATGGFPYEKVSSRSSDSCHGGCILLRRGGICGHLQRQL